MSKATVSIYGINSYMHASGTDLFSQMILPEGVDKDILVDNILIRSADFEALYPDGDFMIEAIGHWSRKWFKTFEKWNKALNIEYNPLENYDRMEEWTDTGRTSELSHNNTNASDSSSGSVNGSSTDYISAFNSDTARQNTSNVSNSDSVNNMESHASNTFDSLNNTENLRTGRAHGNIGVTTSQQMLEAELTIAQWNIYEHITDMFLAEFCIPVY